MRLPSTISWVVGSGPKIGTRRPIGLAPEPLNVHLVNYIDEILDHLVKVGKLS